MFCQAYWAERGLKTSIARLHNVYGPHGWDGGREKAPAALCRKVVEAVHEQTGRIVIRGDGRATRSRTGAGTEAPSIPRTTRRRRNASQPPPCVEKDLTRESGPASRRNDPGAPTVDCLSPPRRVDDILDMLQG